MVAHRADIMMAQRGDIMMAPIGGDIFHPILFHNLIYLYKSGLFFILPKNKSDTSKDLQQLPNQSIHVKIGVPKELKNNENRVAVTPAGVLELSKRNH